MIIHVRTLTDKQYDIEIGSYETILDLKNKIFEKSGVSIEQYRLIYAGKDLQDDNKTLSEYNICRESSINLILKMRGGGFTFSSFNDCQKYNVTISKGNEPDFILIGSGLNLKTKCDNLNCATQEYDGNAVIRKGFGKFDISEIISMVCCPSCFMQCKCTTCGVYDCVLKYEGKLENSNDKKNGTYTVENQYFEFSDDQIKWQYLSISVTKRFTNIVIKNEEE